MLVLAEFENPNYAGRGVGAVVTAPPGLAPRLRLHANVSLLLVDARGEVLIVRNGGALPNAQLQASELGLGADLALLNDADKQARLVAALKREMLAALAAASSSMGY